MVTSLPGSGKLVAAGANWQKSSGEAAYVRTELDRFERQTDDHFAKSDVSLNVQQTEKVAVLVAQRSKRIEAMLAALSEQAEAQNKITIRWSRSRRCSKRKPSRKRKLNLAVSFQSILDRGGHAGDGRDLA